MGRGAPEHIGRTRPIANKAPRVHPLPPWVYGREPALRRKVGDALSFRNEHRARPYEESIGPSLGHRTERPSEIVGTSRFHALESHPQGASRGFPPPRH